MQIALSDLLDRKILTDRQDHLAPKDPLVLIIQIVLLVRKAQIVLLARKAQIVLAGLIEEKDRLARIEPRGHHVPRVGIEPTSISNRPCGSSMLTTATVDRSGWNNRAFAAK